MEIWKTINCFESYEVSNYGCVRSIDREVPYSRAGKVLTRFCKGKTLSQGRSTVGYLTVALCDEHHKGGKTFAVHSLVASHFLVKPEGCVINHKDGNKTNNHVSNLGYISSGENNKHAYKMGLKASTSKISCFAGEVQFDSIQSLAESLGISAGCAWYRVSNGLNVDGVLYRCL